MSNPSQNQSEKLNHPHPEQEATREHEAETRQHEPLQPGPKEHPEGVGDPQASRVKRDEHQHADPEQREAQRKLQAEHDEQLLKDKAQRDQQSKQYDPKVATEGQKRDRDAHEQARAQEGVPLDTAAKAQRDKQASRQGVPGGLQDRPDAKQWPEGVSPNPELGPVPLAQDRNMGDPHPLSPALYDPVPPPGSPLAELQEHNAKNPTRTAEEVMNELRAKRAKEEKQVNPVAGEEQRDQREHEQGKAQLSKQDLEYQGQHVDPQKEAARQHEITRKEGH